MTGQHDSMADSLKVNIAILPDVGLHLVFSEGPEWFERCFLPGAPPDFILNRVDVDCLVTRSGSTVLVRGGLNGKISAPCSRCLETVSLNVGADFLYTLLPAKAEIQEELELSAEDLETGYYTGDFIDLAPLLCEQLVLQVPMKVLCADDCKGLCPRCGENLNSMSCSCRREDVDPRLAVLRNIKVKK